MFIAHRWIVLSLVFSLAALIGFAHPVAAAGQEGRVYYVHYDDGSDSNDGRSPDRPFRHAPGDANARARAAAVELRPGDVVHFKGGVRYRGTIRPGQSGSAGAPIRYDGNTDGAWGTGPAIIDGSEPIDDWRPLTSAEEARGNPHWESIYVGTVGGEIEPRMINLTQGLALFTLARDPKSADPFFMDHRGTMRNINPPRPEDRGRAAIDSSHLFRNSAHPLTLMVDGRDNTLAIVDPLDNARLDFHIPAEARVRRLAITTDRRSTRPRDIAFLVDGEEVLTETLPNRHDHFEFELDRPVSFTTLTLEIRSVHDGGDRHGGIRRVQAFDQHGADVLRIIERGSTQAYAAYTDDKAFTHEHPDHFAGSYLAIHAGHNFIYYRRVIDYFPDEHTIHTEPIAVSQYEGDRGRFAMLNVLGAITVPGEFYVSPDTDERGRRRIYAWPFDTGEEGPEGISASRRSLGFGISGRNHIEIAGFIIEKHGGGGSWGINIADSDHITIRNNEIRLGRRGGVQASRGKDILIRSNFTHHNRGRGFRLHSVADAVVTGNRLHKNGSTGIGFYVSRGIEISHNKVTGHTGVHANALTVYAESEDVLIEGNRSWENNISLTMQNVTNVTVRNNILHSTGNVVGMWTGYHRNVRYEHNALIGPEHHDTHWVGGLFTNGDVERVHVHNNIIAGTSGALPGEYSHNIYTRLGPNEDADNLPEASRHVPDLNALFNDPDNRDYTPRPGSPAIHAGVDLGVERDIDGNSRPFGSAPDIGPYEHQGR